jgi:anti-sigma regulatory factor (Ser/Thr protein kinase)
MTSDAQGRPRRDRRTPAAPPDAVPPAARHTEPILDEPVDGDSLYQLRASVAAHAVLAGLSPRKVDDLVIAAHELAANVVLHGSGRGRLRIWRCDSTLHCQVTDDGSESREDSAETARSGGEPGSPDPSSWRIEPGHGLWLIRQLADDLSLRRGPGGGSAVTVSFSLTSSDCTDGTEAENRG